MVSLGQVALDGTKVRANASRRKAMSYARMSEKQKILAAGVSDLLAEAEKVDKDEDATFGEDNKGLRAAGGAGPPRGPARADHAGESGAGSRGRRAGPCCR